MSRQFTKEIKGKFFAYFQGALGLKKSTKGWYRTDCPSCNGNHTFGYNPGELKAHCFKCEVRYTAVSLLMMMQRFETYNEVRNFLEIQKEYDRWESGKAKEKVEVKKIELPPHYHLLSVGEGEFATCARNYMKGRGFSVNSLSLRGVGYCDDGLYMGYIVFPIYYRGELVYWQTRKFLDIGPKMKNPPSEEFGVGKETILFNADSLFMYNTIMLAESITNSLTWGDNSVAGLGKSLSTVQINKLITSPVDNFIIGLDPDAIDKSINLALQMCHYKNVKLVRFPDGQDINSIGKHEAKKIVRLTKWGTYMDFLKMKNELNEKRGIYTYNRGSSGIMPSRGY